MPQRTLFWPSRKILVATDLHWGKTETFRRHGIPIPDGILANDLHRLEHAALATQAEHLIVLGDLVHAVQDMSTASIDKILEFRARLPIALTLVRGNHDRNVDGLAHLFGIEVFENTLDLAPFSLRHEPSSAAGRFVLAGHVHPMFSLRGAGDSIRFPCFHTDTRGVCILPAFSAFTAGVDVRPARGDHIHAIAGSKVVQLWP